MEQRLGTLSWRSSNKPLNYVNIEHKCLWYWRKSYHTSNRDIYCTIVSMVKYMEIFQVCDTLSLSLSLSCTTQHDLSPYRAQRNMIFSLSLSLSHVVRNRTALMSTAEWSEVCTLRTTYTDCWIALGGGGVWGLQSAFNHNIDHITDCKFDSVVHAVYAGVGAVGFELRWKNPWIWLVCKAYSI